MYPVRYEADYVEPQNRAKTFFRLAPDHPLVHPGEHLRLVAAVVAFLAWFALLFTGRYPEGLYNFNVGFLRFTGRVYAFACCRPRSGRRSASRTTAATPSGWTSIRRSSTTTAGRPGSG